MSMVLDHAIVRARNKERSAAFFANTMGLKLDGPFGPFTKVRVNEELALLFDDRFEFAIGHFAFLVDDDTFDTVLGRLKASDGEFGSGPAKSGNDRRIAYRDGGRSVYMRDPDGNSYELLTAAW